MADSDTAESEENTTPPPTEEEQQTETVNDNVEEPQEPEPKNEEPDVSARLDNLEKELAALKAMLDTLGYDDTPSDNENAESEESGESIEDLFD